MTASTNFRGRPLAEAYPLTIQTMHANASRLSATQFAAHSGDRVASTIELLLRFQAIDEGFANDLRRAFFCEILSIGSAKWPDFVWEMEEDDDLVAIIVKRREA